MREFTSSSFVLKQYVRKPILISTHKYVYVDAQSNNFRRQVGISSAGFRRSFQELCPTSQPRPALTLRDCVAMNEWTILVISSGGARDLTLFSYMRRKDSSLEFILSKAEGARNGNCETLSLAGKLLRKIDFSREVR